MPVVVATHSGPFHADDVLAWALLRQFMGEDLELIRTRDAERLKTADVVIDVGGEYDPGRLRFDHHQHSYQGEYSSAGMVLQWLLDSGRILMDLHDELRTQLVSYVDDVDNGRVAPILGVPCFPSLVGSYNLGCKTSEDFLNAFLRAGTVAEGYLHGIASGVAEMAVTFEVVREAMAEAERLERNYLVLEEYVKWKKAYFEMGGETHPTEFVLHPGTDGSWRAVAIPPEAGSFAQKRSLPESWAGLRDEELESETGVPGARFCHKNRFIAVWETREQLERALRQAKMLR